MLPLNGMRVVEVSDGKMETVGRLLADLGAEVILVEPPRGTGARRRGPMVDGESLYAATHHANKRSVVVDLTAAEGQAAFDRLLGTAHLLVDTTEGGTLEHGGLDVDALTTRYPGLVVLSVSDFGRNGPYRNFVATNAVHTAMAGVLCRSGLPGLPPLLPPGELALECAAIQVAWVALLAFWQRLQTGRGDHVDVSIYETVAQVLDAGLGVTGSASAGKSALDAATRGRPVPMPLYPIFACKDGHVRICVLNPRQWEAMSAWLGPDHEFTDPKFGNLATRAGVIGKVNALIGELFARSKAVDLLAEGQRRGVPIAIVATPADVLADEHFEARGAFVPLQMASGRTGRVPSGFLEIDGRRAGIRSRAPALGQHTAEVLGGLADPSAADPEPAAAADRKRRPLEGVRVLDLGIIVAGAEAGRLLADQGAEVIKVENKAFPDGGRQSLTGDLMTASFAQGHRNKESFGVNLRSDKGRELFKQLVAKSDVVLSNFKPGTLASLGLDYDVLSRINPRIIMMDSSALGNTGPQSRSLGYGPLVRASTGLTSLWSYPDVPNSFSDGVTIYPDHTAARVAVVGVMALLIRRERTGAGGTVSVSQAELFLNSNAYNFLRESLCPGSFTARGNVSEFLAPEGVYACAGEDEWCAVSVRDDEEWRRLLQLIGREDLLADVGLATVAGRIARRAEVDAIVSEWTSRHSPRDVMRLLQGVRIPAGMMQRLAEYQTCPQFAARTFIRAMEHPGIGTPLPTENVPAHAKGIPFPELRAAPYQAEHTRQIAERLLGLSGSEIDRLIASGDLEDLDASLRLAAVP